MGALLLGAAALLALHGVGVADEAAEEEGLEWSVTVCYHEGLDCMDEEPVCMERTSDDEDGLGTCSSYTDEDSGEVVNTSPFPSDEGFLRIRCATDKAPAGPLPLIDIDGIPQKVLTLDWFKKPDCTDRMCLHTIDLDHSMCEVPQCMLDPEPGEAFRKQDEECQCADPPQCRQPAPMSCGMCTPKYPQGWEHGKCINLCMDGSDGWIDGSANEPGTDSKLLDPRDCNVEQLASAVVVWEGLPCENTLRQTGLIVLSSILVPTGLVLIMLATKWVRNKELLCWKPNGRCFGKRCGRIVIVLDDPNAGLSKYEIKMKERKRDQATQQKWAQHRRTEKKDEKRHDKLRKAAFEAQDKAPGGKTADGKKRPGAGASAVSGGGRTTKVRPEVTAEADAGKKVEAAKGDAGKVEAEKASRRKEGSDRQAAKEAKKEENRLRAEERRRENQLKIRREREEEEQAKQKKQGRREGTHRGKHGSSGGSKTKRSR